MTNRQKSRRDFLLTCVATTGAIMTCSLPTLALEADSAEFKGTAVFRQLLKSAIAENWSALPMGELIGKIARKLEGTKYVASTLEIYPDREICSVNLDSLDCVTFVETTLAFARMLKKGGRKPEDLLAEVALIRYRGGTAGDYSSRLHYMSDWLADNSNKHIVKLLGDLPGSKPFTQKVGFMSTHPASYQRLINQPEQVEKIKNYEAEINSRTLTYVPMAKIAAVEALLKTGDIVAVCTKQAGLDVVHTGFVYRTPNGTAHFIDASSTKGKMKVTLEAGAISTSLHWSQNLIGAMFARPLEVKP
ncbi:MAG: N-acetylmuramoyl-L-alanine amidase-like domain-containing protein [Candidatus Obscuribacterales bacterium]